MSATYRLGLFPCYFLSIYGLSAQKDRHNRRMFSIFFIFVVVPGIAEHIVKPSFRAVFHNKSIIEERPEVGLIEFYLHYRCRMAILTYLDFIFSLSAFTFSGLAGKRVTHIPTALCIALIIAGCGAVRGNSPAPDAPQGPNSRGVSR